MLKWILGIAAGLVWCVLVFLVTWYVTFPSQAVVDRVAYLVQDSTDGKYAVKAASSSPWWTGVSLQGVTVFAVDDEGGGTPMLLADSVSASTSLFSLITGGLPVHAVIDLDGSPVVIDAELDRSQNPPRLTKLDAEARSLDAGAVTQMLRPMGVNISGTGTLEVLLDAEIAEKVDDHDGRAKITGEDLTLDLRLPDPISGGEFIIEDMAISEIDLVLDVSKGKAELKRGRISSDRADIDIDLDADLNKNFQRTRLKGKMVLSNLGGELKTFEAAFAGAKWPDGKYHYRISCTIAKLSGNCIKPDRKPTSRGGAAAPSSEEIRNRIERNRDRPVATPEDRAANANANRRRPGSDRDDEREDDRERDEDEEDEDEDEPLDDEEEPAHNEVQVDLDVALPPNGLELPPSPNDIPEMLPPR